jgi:hypothetical protein
MPSWQYSPDVLTFANDFVTRTATQVGPDEFQTVEEFDVDDGESVELGVGQDRNPTDAQGSVSGDIQDNGGSDINGRFRFVVLTPSNNVVRILASGSIDRLELTRSNGLDGYLLPRTDVEVKDPYEVGFQLRTNSGSSTYSGSNSSLDVDAITGEQVG